MMQAPTVLSQLIPALRAVPIHTKIRATKRGFQHDKKIAHTQISRTQNYRAVASLTAIETGASVQKIE